MNQKVQKTLEFDKIKQLVAEHTVSPLGAQKVLAMEPQDDMGQITTMLKKTAEAESIVVKRPALPLSGFPDMGRELARLRTGASLNCRELLHVAQLLKASHRARTGLVGSEDVSIPQLSHIASGLYVNENLSQKIDHSIMGEDEVSDGASSELRDIRRRIRSENESIKEKLNAILRGRNSYLQDAIVTMRNGRYVVPVKQEYRSAVKGIVHSQSSSGATLFIEPMSVVESNNRLAELEAAEQKEIERILMMLSDMARPYLHEFQSNIDILVHLDEVFAKALYAVHTKSIQPKMNEEGEIRIISGRHPLIQESKVVPITILIGKRYHGLIITGPNTGGKTVTLKVIGLFQMMAQCGMYVPALEGTTLSVYREIYADIGDEQSIEQSLSTFSSHMKNITYILNHADEESLILLDELGAGTDPQEGSALAIAILEELAKRRAKLAATTHYTEIKAFAMQAEDFVNASMEFDVKTLMPTYKILMGVAGASNAFLISKRLGVADYIIDRATQLLSNEKIAFDSILSEAEKARSRAEKKYEKAATAQKKASQLEKEASQKVKSLEEKREKILQKANEQALEIVNRARQEAEDVIGELKKLKNAPESQRTKVIEQARKELRQNKEAKEKVLVKKAPKSKAIKKEQLALGDRVKVLSMDVEADVLTLPDDKGMLRVQAGILQMNVALNDIALLQESKKQPSGQRTSSIQISRQKSVPLELDVHGKTVSEAEVEMDQYLDDAFLAGYSEVSIIHGKGTGALRQGVHAYLRTNPHVASFRLGKYGEGEAGVTVVTLK